MSSAPNIIAKLAGISLWAWFVGTGAAEMAIALLAAYGFHAPYQVLWVLLPTLMLLFNPDTPHGMAAFVDGVILFGGSFAIWGTVGLIAGVLVRAVRSALSNQAD